jgi:hypothetical protein
MMMRTTLAWNMDEPGWDRREDIAEAIAHPLGIQPSIKRH